MTAARGIHYRVLGGYKYMLLVPYGYETGITGYSVSADYYSLQSGGRLNLWAGYAWDGASGPARDTEDFMRASLVHDGLYQLIREGHIDEAWRKRADEIMREIAREDGMGRFRAWYTYTAVRLFGGRHNRRHSPVWGD